MVMGSCARDRYRCPRTTHTADIKRIPLMHVKFESLGGEMASSRLPFVHAENASTRENLPKATLSE